MQALQPERGGPKNLPVLSTLLSDWEDEENRGLAEKPHLVIVGGGWGVRPLFARTHPLFMRSHRPLASSTSSIPVTTMSQSSPPTPTPHSPPFSHVRTYPPHSRTPPDPARSCFCSRCGWNRLRPVSRRAAPQSCGAPPRPPHQCARSRPRHVGAPVRGGDRRARRRQGRAHVYPVRTSPQSESRAATSGGFVR